MFCPKCGETLPDDAVFCGVCGAKLEKPAAVPPAGAGIPGATIPGGATPTPTVPAAYAARRSSKKPLIIGIAAVAVLAAIGIGVYMAFFAPYNIDDKAFPDDDLRSVITKQIDKDRDGKITRDEAKAVSKLDLSGTDVESLEGIQVFENMAELDISGCADLKQVDLSKLTKLETVNARGSGLKEIDVSKLAELESLNVVGTAIDEIDVSGNEKLESFKVDDAVDVVGVSSTQIREQWLVTEVYEKGYFGTYDAQAGSDPTETRRVTYTYDDDNQLIEYRYAATYPADLKYDDYTYTQKYTYDDGRLVSGETSNSTTGIFEQSEVRYDDEGNVVEIVSTGYSSNDSSSTTRFEYNKDGKMTQRAQKYSSGSYYSMDFEYDKNGRFAAVTAQYNNVQVTYNDQGLVGSVGTDWELFEFDYNDKGQVSEKRVYWLNNGKKGDSYTKVVFEYDSEGRIISAVRTTEGAKDYSYKSEASVEYDKHGNAVKRKVSYTSVSGGKTYTSEGATQITYKRVFVAKGDQVDNWVTIGDPTNVVSTDRPIALPLFDEKQSDMVLYAMSMFSTIRAYV